MIIREKERLPVMYPKKKLFAYLLKFCKSIIIFKYIYNLKKINLKIKEKKLLQTNNCLPFVTNDTFGTLNVNYNRNGNLYY